MKKDFYIKQYSYLQNEEDFDIKNIPPIMRRKLSPLDKAAFSTLNKLDFANAEKFIYSSEQGEISRLQNIINQYKETNEVSPAHFSASVHNYFIGFFTLFNKLNISYNAISSGKNSISAGLIDAITSKENNILFCYADFADGIKSISCYISNDKISDGIKCSYTQDISESTNCEFKSFIDFFNNKTSKFSTTFGLFERLN